jgi:hypothetical protein
MFFCAATYYTERPRGVAILKNSFVYYLDVNNLDSILSHALRPTFWGSFLANESF